MLNKVAARPLRDTNGIHDDNDNDDKSKVIPNGNTRGELHGAEQAERAAAAHPGGTVQLERVIKRIIAA